jgi:CBS domain-containing protein
MSSRAASRLEVLGFSPVYDYVGGKADWGSFGLPLEGENDSRTRVGSLARADVPTCRPGDLISTAADRVAAGDWDVCVVTTERNVVVGLLGRQALRSGESVAAERVMTEGPSTIRPSARLGAIGLRMHEQQLAHFVVTRSDGVFIGVLRREDVEEHERSVNL